MATRGVYIFEDKNGFYKVYKHYHNYPEMAFRFIKNALKLAWPLPRFEADEFAAAFVASSKSCAGEVRLINSDQDDFGQDYTYRVSLKNDRIFIEFDDHDNDGNPMEFAGTLDDLEKYVEKEL